MFCLLFVQVSGEGEDVGVDLLGTSGSFAGHDGVLGVVSCGWFSRVDTAGLDCVGRGL